MEETNKRQIRFDLKKKILMLGVLPVLVLGLMVIFIAQTIVRDSLLKEIKDALQSAATSTFAAYDQNSGDYIKTENGEIWKGSYNISKSESLVDSIKEKTGLEVTFFYGKDRIMTSAKDKNGDRILGSPAGETIQKEVLEKGKEYFSDSVSIDGTLHYGYYVPVYQGDSKKPVGMIFVGANKAQKDSAINKIINTVILVVLIVMLLCIAVAAVFAFNFSRALKKGINMVQSVSSGNLKNEMDTQLIKRQDELGDLSKAISSLQEEMIKSIANIAGNAEAVLMASGELGETAREAEHLLEQPKNAKGKSAIPSGTKLLSVTTVDGVCYVNFDAGFTNQDYEIQEPIVIYSIVDSLSELSTVSKVQISVNGSTKGVYRDSYKLDKIYDRNLDYLEEGQKKGEKTKSE